MRRPQPLFGNQIRRNVVGCSIVVVAERGIAVDSLFGFFGRHYRGTLITVDWIGSLAIPRSRPSSAVPSACALSAAFAATVSWHDYLRPGVACHDCRQVTTPARVQVTAPRILAGTERGCLRMLYPLPAGTLDSFLTSVSQMSFKVAIVGNLPQRTRSFDRAVEVMKQRLDPK
jgi:hypothetical protein